MYPKLLIQLVTIFSWTSSPNLVSLHLPSLGSSPTFLIVVRSPVLVTPSHLPVFLRLVFHKALCLVLLFSLLSSMIFLRSYQLILLSSLRDDTAIYIISNNLISFPTSITVMLCGQAALKKNHVGWNLFSTLGVRLFFVGNMTLPPLLLSRNLD